MNLIFNFFNLFFQLYLLILSYAYELEFWFRHRKNSERWFMLQRHKGFFPLSDKFAVDLEINHFSLTDIPRPHQTL
jgi:hypothetical protein